jgi:hypothetical protein
LDVFDGPVGTNQVYDYSPPIAPSGLFWLFELPPAGVRADVARGTAMMRASNLPMPDYHDVESSLKDGPTVPAIVSFDVEWSTVIARAARRNEAETWGGEYVETESRIAWSARQEGFAYQSDPLGTSTSVWGVVGRQRSGVYFRQLGLPRTGDAPARSGVDRSLGVAGAAGAAGAALVLAGFARRRGRA